MSMEKYGKMAESIVCVECDGTGKKNLGKSHWVQCSPCNGTGRKRMKVDPIKEAAEIKKEIGENNDNKQKN